MKDKNLRYKYYLQDLIPTLLENAKELQNEEKDDYCQGKLFAYYDILTIMQQDALAFGIDLQEIGLPEIKEKDFFFANKSKLLLANA